MADIRIDHIGELTDGQSITFKAPCDCTEIECLKVYYPNGSGERVSRRFEMRDAHCNCLTGLGNLFKKDSYVHAILDTKNGFAYLQNSNNNSYIAEKLDWLTPTKVASGTDITIGDASGIALAGMKLFGKTTQGENPSPSNPQELESKGVLNADTGQKEIETVVRGGNLFDKNNVVYGAYMSTGVFTTTVTDCCGNHIDTTKNKTITVSGVTKADIGIYFAEFDNAGNFISRTNTLKNGTFTVNGNCVKVWVACYVDDIDTFMVNYGTSALPYEPYNGCSMISKVGKDGLCGIPVIDSSLANHVDENGQMWCCDEIDFERGKKIQRVKERTFSSSDGWDVMTLDDNVSVFYTPVGDMLNASKLLCDKYTSPYHSSSERVGDKRVTANMGTGLYVWVRDDSYNGDLAAFKADLSENPITVQYILATPIETDLTPDEITQYRNLHTNKSNTIIQNDCDAEMEVEYYTESHDGAFGRVMRELTILREQVALLTSTLADVTTAMIE